MGKLLVANIPAYRKEPRGERPAYSGKRLWHHNPSPIKTNPIPPLNFPGYDETTRIVTEAEQCLQGVIFNAGGLPHLDSAVNELPIPDLPHEASMDSPRIDFDRDFSSAPAFSNALSNPINSSSNSGDGGGLPPPPRAHTPRVESEPEYPVAQAFTQGNYAYPERTQTVDSRPSLPKPPQQYIPHDRDQYQYDYDDSSFYARNNAVAVHGASAQQDYNNNSDNNRPIDDLTQGTTSEFLDNVAENLLGRQKSPNDNSGDRALSSVFFPLKT